MQKNIFGLIVLIGSIFLSGLFFESSCVYAENINFNLAMNRDKVSLGESVELRMKFDNTQKVPAPQIPSSDGLEAQYYGPSTMMSFVNGSMNKSITHVYSIRPLKQGKYNIGPFSFHYNGDDYKSNELVLEVVSTHSSVSQGSQAQLNSSARTGDVSLDDYVFLSMDIPEKEVYINQIFPVTLKLFISQFAVRDIEFPVIEHDGFSLEDFDKPKQYRQIVDGESFDVVEFKTHAFATRAGLLSLGPVDLKCNLLFKQRNSRSRDPFGNDMFGSFFSGFFDSYDKKEMIISAKKTDILVKDIPVTEKPAGFDGALGNYVFSLEHSDTKIKVGDPVTLKMTITGNGNMRTVKVPKPSSFEGFKVYAPQVNQSQGVKCFEQIIMPLDVSVSEIPEISFTFFNMKTGKYETQTKGPIPLEVSKSEGTENLTIVEMPVEDSRPVIKEVFGRDIVYLKNNLGEVKEINSYYFRNSFYLFLHGVLLFLFILASMGLNYRRKIKTDEKFARSLVAHGKAKKGISAAQKLIKRNDVTAFFDVVFRTFQEYIGNKFHVSAAGITIDVVDGILKDKDVPVNILDKTKKIFSDCDIARYAASEFGTKQMHETVENMKIVIDYFERQRL